MKAHILRSLIALLVLACGFAPSAVFAEDATKIWLSGVKSTVQVLNMEGNTAGSGSVVNLSDGYILTNWHVVRGGKEVVIVFPMWENNQPIVESEKYKPRKIGQIAKVVASEEKIDLAIVKIIDVKKIPEGTLAVKFADASPLPGSKLISIGNPGASKGLWILTPGDVRSVYTRKWTSQLDEKNKITGKHNVRIIEATSPTNHGDSGGPCFNDKGEQVGITQGGLDASAANGFSIFIDASEAKTFLKANKVPFNGDNNAADIAKKETAPIPEINKDPAPIPKDPPKVDPAADKKAKDEKAAASTLKLIRPLVSDPNRQTFALEKLQALIKMYPDTDAAKEAAELVKKIK